LKSASAIIISRIFHLPVLLFTILAAKLSVSRIVAHRSLQLSPQIRAMAPSDVQSQRPAASESMEMTNSQPVLADQPKRQQEMGKKDCARHPIDRFFAHANHRR
jgi:hypothetical protein